MDYLPNQLCMKLSIRFYTVIFISAGQAHQDIPMGVELIQLRFTQKASQSLKWPGNHTTTFLLGHREAPKKAVEITQANDVTNLIWFQRCQDEYGLF
jgi:hypothetical protein